MPPCLVIVEALPGVLGNRGIISFISGERVNKVKKEGNRISKVISESREHRK